MFETTDNRQNLLKGEKMTEVHFTDLAIVGNHATKPPRKDGKNEMGQDQFIITFSLSRHANGYWTEAFNRVCGEQDNRTRYLRLPLVKDDQIQILCPIDDQLQVHLDDLKQLIEMTNRLCREQLSATDEEKRHQVEILQRLRF